MCAGKRSQGPFGNMHRTSSEVSGSAITARPSQCMSKSLGRLGAPSSPRSATSLRRPSPPKWCSLPWLSNHMPPPPSSAIRLGPILSYIFAPAWIIAAALASAPRRTPAATKARWLMPEMAHAREDHRQPVLVRRGDHLVVAHAAARLDDRACARLRDDVQPVAEREEGIRRDDGAAQREPRVLRLDRRDARGIDAAHL